MNTSGLYSFHSSTPDLPPPVSKLPSGSEPETRPADLLTLVSNRGRTKAFQFKFSPLFQQQDSKVLITMEEAPSTQMSFSDLDNEQEISYHDILKAIVLAETKKDTSRFALTLLRKTTKRVIRPIQSVTSLVFKKKQDSDKSYPLLDLPDDILRRILRHADYHNGMVINRGVVLALTCKRLWELYVNPPGGPRPYLIQVHNRLMLPEPAVLLNDWFGDGYHYCSHLGKFTHRTKYTRVCGRCLGCSGNYCQFCQECDMDLRNCMNHLRSFHRDFLTAQRFRWSASAMML